MIVLFQPLFYQRREFGMAKSESEKERIEKHAKEVGRQLYEARIRRNLTLAELAQKTGASTTSISRWEKGEALPTPKLRKPLVEALGLSMEIFIVPQEEPITEAYGKGREETLLPPDLEESRSIYEPFIVGPQVVKVYRGRRFADVFGEKHTIVEVNGYPLRVCPNDWYDMLESRYLSLDGQDLFAWGKGQGKGSLYLAKSLLLDYFQEYPDENWYNAMVPYHGYLDSQTLRYAGQFHLHVITRLPFERNWEMSNRDIWRWLEEEKEGRGLFFPINDFIR
jgi:transcriptional regulator with XRE-family HTH domain